MSRELPISNGSLLINFDADYLLRDIYFPNVGGINHTLGHPSRFGVWTEGQFSWISSPDWEKSLRYQDGTLITHVTAVNSVMGIKLTINDAVDCLENIYIRRMEVENLSEQDRQIRILISHDLHIWETRVGDTVYYDPRTSSIIQYKRTRYFLINASHSNGAGIDQYAIGIQEYGETEGTWRDAEDGILGGNPIADGNVDSTIALHLDIPAGGKTVAHYWITAGRKYGEVTALNRMIIDHSPDYYINRTASYWRAWLRKDPRTKLAHSDGQTMAEDVILPDNIIDLYKNSLFILSAHIDNSGAIIAANDMDIEGMDSYSYMWPRDGAMIAYALDEAGYLEPTKRFFQFCANVITSEGYFLHKYNPDRSFGSSWLPWVSDGQIQLPIQEDETALVVWSFWHHFQKHKDIEFIRRLYEPLVTRPGDFMIRYRDEATGLPLPSYDLWEERRGIHTFTASAVCAGLTAAANFSEVCGDTARIDQFRAASEKMKTAINKHLYSEEHRRFLRKIVPRDGDYEKDLTVDSSMYGTFAFGAYDVHDEKVKGTMQAIHEKLTVKTDVGGIARYEGDPYQKITEDVQNVPGNPWIICKLWMAQYVIAEAETISELQKAVPMLQWVAKHALGSGMLPEQLDPYTGKSISVSPLAWSHGEFILTVHKFINKLNSFSVGCKD